MASYAMHGRRRLALLLALASLLCPDALRPTFLVPTGALRPSARPARQIGVRHARPARMPAPDGAEDGELRSALSLASDCLGGGDDAGAARALMPHMGALLNANFGAVTEHVDELTREFVLVLVEEFVREATQLDLKRRRTLKSIVETALKDADGVDATLLKLREEVADAALVLQLVDEEIAKLQNAPNQEMRLIDFFQALRLRLMDELGAAVYGDAARALRFVLSCDTAADRDAALLQALGACETREEKQAFHHVLASTREHAREGIQRDGPRGGSPLESPRLDARVRWVVTVRRFGPGAPTRRRPQSRRSVRLCSCPARPGRKRRRLDALLGIVDAAMV